MFDIENLIKKEFLGFNNKKVSDENLNEYLTSFKNDELTRFAITQIFVDKDYLNLLLVKNLNNRPKKYIIEYITDNLNVILETYIKIINVEEIDLLKYIIKNNGEKIFLKNKSISIHFIGFLKLFSLAKVEYNSKEESIKFFMPKEFIEVLEKGLNNNKLLEINKYNNKVFTYIETVINTYGIITLDKLHEIFEKQMFKIDKEELNHIIESMCTYEELNIHIYNEEKLFCNVEFIEEDFALYFYENQKKEYKIFSKEDYKLISEGNYIDKLKSYNKFIDYLCKNYKGIEKDIKLIKDFIVNDYISSAQVFKDVAKDNFINNIQEILEADDKTLKELLTLIDNIFKEYPKWIKRGNI